MTDDSEVLLQEMTRTMEDFARQRGYILSRVSSHIIRELVRMRQQFGHSFCPCQPENSADTVCICAEVRRGYVDEMGKCHCNLFLKG